MPEFPDIDAVLCRKKLTPKHTPALTQVRPKQAADQKASSGKFISELPPDIRVAKWVPLRGSIRCM